MQNILEVAVLTAVFTGTFVAVFIADERKAKKLARWKKRRERAKRAEMTSVGDRVTREMQYEQALNSSIIIPGKHQKVVSKGHFAVEQADVWAIDKNEVQVIL